MRQLTFEQFVELKQQDDNLYLAGTSAEEALNIIFNHFFGDAPFVDPISRKQINSYYVAELLRKYPDPQKKKNWFVRQCVKLRNWLLYDDVYEDLDMQTAELLCAVNLLKMNCEKCKGDCTQCMFADIATCDLVDGEPLSWDVNVFRQRKEMCDRIARIRTCKAKEDE